MTRHTPTVDPAAPAPWATSATPEALAQWLRDQRSVVLLTHIKPDGDALGSTLALARAINRAAAQREPARTGVAAPAECWYAAPVPPWGPGLFGGVRTRCIEEGQPVPGVPDPEAIVICDTGAWNQLAPFEAFLRARTDRCAVIDHHLAGNADVAPRRLIDTAAAAVCQPVATLCCRLLGAATPAALPADIAEPLYVGLATDTGWFRHSNVGPAVMRLASELLEAGAEHVRLYEQIQQRERSGRLRLMARALASLEIHEDRNLAMMTLTEHDFRDCGASPGDSGGFVDIPMSVESVRVVAILTETELNSPQGPLTKISLRSKELAFNSRPPVDVNRAAQKLGGGGHARAAGARLRMPLFEAKAEVLGVLR
jgi:phosphoesterase RecJ-like protein